MFGYVTIDSIYFIINIIHLLQIIVIVYYNILPNEIKY